MSLSDSSALFRALISTVDMSKRRCLFTWVIFGPPRSRVLFSVLVFPYLLPDGVLVNTEGRTDGACPLGDILTFPRILLRVTFFRIVLAGLVLDLDVI